MNLLKSKLRRTSAVIAGSIIGLAGVAVFAAPASAHAPTVKGETSCVKDDAWTATWHIGNDYDSIAHASSITVTEYKGDKAGDPKTVDSITNETVFKANSDKNEADQITAETKVTDKDVTKVKIKVILVWEDGYTNNGEKAANGKTNGAPLTATVEKGEECTKPNPEPSESTSSPASPSPSASTPETPATPEIPVPTPSSSTPSEVKPILEFDCDTMTLGLVNPADSIPLKLDYDTSKGEHRSVTVNPGDKAAEKFSAKPGFSIKLTLSATVDGETQSDFVKVDYQQPADCDNSGQAGGLPVTGAAAGGIAGGAAVLLVAGGVLFVMARRRKVKFTA